MQNELIRIPYKRNGIRGKGFIHQNPIFAAWGCSENFIERFWRRVIKTDHCWIWDGPLNEKGYGYIAYGQRPGAMKAHRASWLIHFGAIPIETPCVLHDCRPAKDCAACVNPAHLWIGTVLDNNADMTLKGVRSPPPKFYGEEWYRIHGQSIR